MNARYSLIGFYFEVHFNLKLTHIASTLQHLPSLQHLSQKMTHNYFMHFSPLAAAYFIILTNIGIVLANLLISWFYIYAFLKSKS